jgi:hypothetical protein
MFISKFAYGDVLDTFAGQDYRSGYIGIYYNNALAPKIMKYNEDRPCDRSVLIFKWKMEIRKPEAKKYRNRL